MKFIDKAAQIITGKSKEERQREKEEFKDVEKILAQKKKEAYYEEKNKQIRMLAKLQAAEEAKAEARRIKFKAAGGFWNARPAPGYQQQKFNAPWGGFDPIYGSLNNNSTNRIKKNKVRKIRVRDRRPRYYEPFRVI